MICNFYTEKRSFAAFCALLRSSADLRFCSFVFLLFLPCFCVRLRLERLRLGTAEDSTLFAPPGNLGNFLYISWRFPY